MSPHAQDTVPTGTNNWWKEATVYQVGYLVELLQL
jgi:alpha-glucosidase